MSRSPTLRTNTTQIQQPITIDTNSSPLQSQESTFRGTPRSTRSLLFYPASAKKPGISPQSVQAKRVSESRAPRQLFCCSPASRAFSCMSLRSGLTVYVLFDIFFALMQGVGEVETKVLFSKNSSYAQLELTILILSIIPSILGSLSLLFLCCKGRYAVVFRLYGCSKLVNQGALIPVLNILLLIKNGGAIVCVVFICFALFQIYGGFLLLSIHAHIVQKKLDIFELDASQKNQQAQDFNSQPIGIANPPRQSQL